MSVASSGITDADPGEGDDFKSRKQEVFYDKLLEACPCDLPPNAPPSSESSSEGASSGSATT